MTKLAFTIDIDNDFLSTPLEKVTSLEWRGIHEALPIVMKYLDSAMEEIGKVLKITIFNRADWQVKEIMGSATWVFDQVERTLSTKFKNLEINYEWHPHLYVKKDGKWMQCLSENEQREQLIEIHNDLKMKDINISVSRIGECYFNNTIMETLIELGVKCDASPLPGRILENTDWENAPRVPYKPSKKSFSEPGDLSLLMVPFTMREVLAPYDNDIPRLRYFNVFYKDKFFTKKLNEENFNEIVTILHPFELYNNAHKLLGGLEALKRNVENIFLLNKIESVFLDEFNYE